MSAFARCGPRSVELGPADLVWCAHVVHHLPDPVAALGDLGRLLSGDGVLVVAEGGLAARFLPGGYGVARPSFVNRRDLFMVSATTFHLATRPS